MKLQNLFSYKCTFAEKYINAEKETRIIYTMKPGVTVLLLLFFLYFKTC